MASHSQSERHGRARRLRLRQVNRTHRLLAVALIGSTFAIVSIIWMIRAWRGSAALGAVAVGGAAALALAFVWYVPKLQLSGVKDRLGEEYPKVENDIRATWAHIIGGLVLLASLGFTWFQTNDARVSTQQSLKIAERGQITDRFTQAIQQLGDDRLELRLGGIYSLEQIAIDSPESHYWPIMQVFTAFVRQHAPLPGSASMAATPTSSPSSSLSADVQAVLTVLARRDTKWDGGKLDLSYTNLSKADLRLGRFDDAILTGANLEDADLSGASLKNAILSDANLVGAFLTSANLEGAWMDDTQMQFATLANAQLTDAILNGADLSGASLTGASLRGARLSGANLMMALDLSQEQIDEAIVSDTTLLPPDIQPPADGPSEEGT